MNDPTPLVRAYLLRHGEVSSHRGDVPITAAAREQAEEVGSRIATEVGGRRITVLSGDTRRTQETAEHLSKGIERSAGVVTGPTVAHALRNPDLYLAGHRVDMVSSPEALAAQVPGLNADDVAALEFFPQFIGEKDRIGWWLRHPNPPGEGASAIADRIDAFARSLINPYNEEQIIVVAVTHSPLLRAVGLMKLHRDIGEPPWTSGLALDIDQSGVITTSLYPESG